MRVEKIDNQRFILLEKETAFSLGYRITIDKGFDFDGASISKPLWSIIGSPFTGNYVRAALFHDGLYACCTLDRKLSDEIFLDLMKEDGVGYFKRYSMYLAVRAFGSSAYNNTPEDISIYKRIVNVTKYIN